MLITVQTCLTLLLIKLLRSTQLSCQARPSSLTSQSTAEPVLEASYDHAGLASLVLTDLLILSFRDFLFLFCFYSLSGGVNLSFIFCNLGPVFFELLFILFLFGSV